MIKEALGSKYHFFCAWLHSTRKQLTIQTPGALDAHHGVMTWPSVHGGIHSHEGQHLESSAADLHAADDHA